MTSWKTPLPNVCVPTTFARWRSCSAPVTISDADAVPLSTSTTSGCVGTIGSPVASSVRSGTERPFVVTILPLRRNALATSWASDTRPPPLPRRSSTNAFGAALLLALQRGVQLGVRARAELREADDAGLHAPARAICDATTGTDTVLRVIDL